VSNSDKIDENFLIYLSFFTLSMISFIVTLYTISGYSSDNEELELSKDSFEKKLVVILVYLAEAELDLFGVM